MPEKALFDKLSVKPAHRMLLVNAPTSYRALLSGLPGGVQLSERPSGEADLIQVFVDDRKALQAELPRLKPYLAPGGILWPCYHEGASSVATDINRDTIWAYARAIGMDAAAQVAIDKDWSAICLKPH